VVGFCRPRKSAAARAAEVPWSRLRLQNRRLQDCEHGDHAPAQPLKSLKIGSAETPSWVLVVVRIDQRRSRVSIEMESTV